MLKNGIVLHRCFWQVLISILCLVMHVSYMYAHDCYLPLLFLRLGLAFFWLRQVNNPGSLGLHSLHCWNFYEAYQTGFQFLYQGTSLQRWARTGLDRTGSSLKPILSGSGLHRTAIFLKFGGWGLDRTEIICVILMWVF